MNFTNSALVSYTKISPNRTKNRKHAIDTITIHCTAGQVSVETLGSIFANAQKQASANYGVGLDGRIGMYVEEKDRSWCSSSTANDNRAVTVEVASDDKHPYAVKDKAYAAMLELVTDICKRNGIKQLVWSDNKNDRINHLNGCNMTVHRDYANKACPGDWLYSRMGDIAKAVNQIIEVKPMEKRYTTVEESPKAYQPALTELAELKCLGGYGDDRGIYLTEDMERIITILKRYIDKKLDAAPNADDIAHELANRLLGGDD